MHTNIHRRERQTNGRGRSDYDSAGDNRQLQEDLRQTPSGARNANRVLTGVTRFEPGRSSPIVVTMHIMILVVIVDGEGRRTVVMAVLVRRWTVLMVGMTVAAVRVHVHCRRSGRRTGHRHREHERKEATHEEESTTSGWKVRQTRGPARLSLFSTSSQWAR